MNRPLFAALLIAGCATPAKQAERAVPAADTVGRLMALTTGSSVRRGGLNVRPQVIELTIKRGNGERVLLNVPRSGHELACAEEPSRRLEVGQARTDDWWIFSDDTHAVALQLTRWGSSLWYWDQLRDCYVHTAALDDIRLDDTLPQQYYGADHAQIAYLWSQGNDGSQTTTGDRTSDLIRDFAGEEELIAASDYIAVRSAEGEVLMQEEFAIDSDWPCFDAQLSVFDRGPQDGLYAVASFESFGTRRACTPDKGEVRYVMVVADWNDEANRFEPTFRISSQRRPLANDGEETSSRVTRNYEVAGGAMQIQSEKRSRHSRQKRAVCVRRDERGTCLNTRECMVWESVQTARTNYVFFGADGVRTPIGAPESSERQTGHDCDTN